MRPSSARSLGGWRAGSSDQVLAGSMGFSGLLCMLDLHRQLPTLLTAGLERGMNIVFLLALHMYGSIGKSLKSDWEGHIADWTPG